ncbi:MAG: hypothetical protein L6Q67_20630 [Zoogloea sp.]|nr:hypothetical protein [Zoogloea sp.]
MRIALCSSPRIGSLLIRAFTWSEYSHAAIIDGDHVIEAVWPRVRECALTEFARKHARIEFIDVPMPDEDAALSAARSQVGKGYDWRALLGIVLRARRLAEKDRWFCSELVAWVAEQGGRPLFRGEVLRRVTPQHLWMLAL